ncbi:MAK10-like protein [Tanacetum coccineum]|uniref:MAK10-like protein n=1 Tax=Tanacetum coccineum TaxID=301880 RepID=A0ABQ4X9L1_9ASTR
MENENPIRTLGDYSKPSHEGYRNTIELPIGNNVVHLGSNTIRLLQNGCSFHGLRFEDPNQHLKDFIKLVNSLDLDVANRERTCLRLFQFSLRDQASNWLERLPAGSISTWEDLTTCFLAQFFPPGRTAKLRNDILMFQQHQGESLSEAWTQNLALYDNESWNDLKDFAKSVKAISLPQDSPNTSDRRLVELENQVQRLMEAHLAPKQSVQVNKITSSCLGGAFMILSRKGLMVDERFFNGAFGGDGEEDFVIGEGVVVSSSSLDMSTKSCLGGMMVSLIFLEGLEEDAWVEAMEVEEK